MNDKLNGITVGGKPVEEYLYEQSQDETKKQAITDFHQQSKKGGLYNDPHTRIKGKKGRSKITTLLPRAQINREYWRKNMGASKNIMQKVVAILLSGEPMTSDKIFLKLREEDGTYQKNQLTIPSRIGKLFESPLGCLMIRKNIGAGRKVIFEWSFTPEAYNMEVAEAYGLYNSRNKKINYQTLYPKYPWLAKYISEKDIGLDETNQPIKKKAIERKRIPINKGVPEQAELKENLLEAIGTMISNSLGVKVTVEGEVKILFGIAK